jgi:hypothetical protein
VRVSPERIRQKRALAQPCCGAKGASHAPQAVLFAKRPTCSLTCIRTFTNSKGQTQAASRKPESQPAPAAVAVVMRPLPPVTARLQHSLPAYMQRACGRKQAARRPR